MSVRIFNVTVLLTALLSHLPSLAQDESVKPGINDSFRDPDLKEFQGKFEIESREVFARRKEIVAACQLKPGLTVADIGAGTGLFTRLFSDAVGTDGRVIAVDISQKFLDHIRMTTREAGQRNVETLLCTADSTELPAECIDVAFICDTYHHFEFPHKTMVSLQKALKPGGRVILIDFRRVPGKSNDWVLNHVRAGQEVFEAEILQAGLEKVQEETELLRENYFVVFEKPTVEQTAKGVKVQESSEDRAVVALIKAHAEVVSQFVAQGFDEAHKNHPVPAIPVEQKLLFPIIPKHGGVMPRPMAVEQPRAGAKVVFDATANANPVDINKGLDRVARLLNLYGASGLNAQDVKITIVLHGEATKSVLSDTAYQAHFDVEQNPNLPLIRELQQAGVEVLVCGQALNYKNFLDTEVADGTQIAAAAMTVVINKQTNGYSYIPVP